MRENIYNLLENELSGTIWRGVCFDGLFEQPEQQLIPQWASPDRTGHSIIGTKPQKNCIPTTVLVTVHTEVEDANQPR